MNFEDWYKNSIEEHREEPPGFVWNEIQNRMDVADVWSNISCEFDDRKERSIRLWIQRSVAAAAILLFMSLNLNTSDGLVNTRTDNTLAEVSPKYTPVITLEKNKTFKAEPSKKYADIIDHEKNNTTSDKIVAILAVNGVSGSNSSGNKRSKLETILDPVLAQYIYNHTASRGMHYLVPMNEFDTGDDYYKIPLKKRISLGVIGSFNNTWILSRQNLFDISDADASSSMSGLGKNIGLIAAIDYSKHLSFQAEFVHTETSQNIKQAFSDKFAPEELLVNYLNFNLLAVHKRKHFFKDIPASHNFIFGGGFGYLTSAKLKDGNVRVDVKEKYTKENISLNLGYEYEIRPAKRWSMAAGIRTNYGLSNIDRVVYSEFNDNRSNTFSWGGHVVVKYHLGY